MRWSGQGVEPSGAVWYSRAPMQRRLAAHALAVVVVAAALLARVTLSRWLGFELPYITFFGAVMAAAWYGGLTPGVLATALSSAAAVYWFVVPSGTFTQTDAGDVIGLLVFLLTGVLVSLAAERLHEARRQIEDRARLEQDERREAGRAQALLAAVVESSEDAILTKSLTGTILSWNAGAEQMFGYTAAEVVGQPVTLIVPPHRRGEEEDIVARVAAGDRVLPFETERVARDGTVLDVSVTLSPIRDAQGRIVGASSIARDIGARKALEASLREADRRKDEFLAVLAHELRNPLAPIRTSVSLLQQDATSPAVAATAAAVIDRQSRHMARLLDDLLDISRITRGKLELRRAPVTLQEVLDTAVETTRRQFELQRQTLVQSRPERLVHLQADAVRLAQVFGNVLSNASKYSEPGATVTLSATADGSRAVVTVRDQGIGIEPELLPRVFDMFVQAPQALGRSHGGLGVGLALTKGLVELHGGQIAVRSGGAGQGTECTITLDTVPIAESADDPAAGTPGARRRVLVVDDNRDAADSLAWWLVARGHTVSTAYDGNQALTQAATFQPEAVLLDLGMPGLDGLETARRLRARAGHAPFLVAVTGWGQDRDRRRTAEAGFDAHLVKPVDPVDLLAVLDRLPR